MEDGVQQEAAVSRGDQIAEITDQINTEMITKMVKKMTEIDTLIREEVKEVIVPKSLDQNLDRDRKDHHAFNKEPQEVVAEVDFLEKAAGLRVPPGRLARAKAAQVAAVKVLHHHQLITNLFFKSRTPLIKIMKNGKLHRRVAISTIVDRGRRN